MITTSATVLVVGAGPVGLTLAAELHRHGVPVRVVDAVPPRPPTESRALGTNTRSLEVFDRLGVLAPMLERGRVLRRFTILSGPRRLAHLALPDDGAGHPTMLMLPQSGTESVLLDALAERGIDVERPVTVTGLDRDGDRVAAVLRREDGTDERVVAEYLVGADGAHSTVRKVLRSDFDGVRLQGQYLVDAEVDWVGPPPEPGEGFFSLSPASMLVVTQVPGARWRVIASMPPGDPRMRRETPTVAAVQAIADADHPDLGSRMRLRDASWASAFHISVRAVPAMRDGRVFLAGDAAHIHSPVGGQGMNTGIADAVNLAWKLALHFRGLGGEALLDSYGAERLPVVRSLLSTTSTMEHLLMLRDPLAARLRNAAVSALAPRSAVRAAAARWLGGQAAAYPAGPAVARSARSPRPGTPAPDVDGLIAPDGRPVRLSALLGRDPRHVALLFTASSRVGSRIRAQRIAAGLTARWGAVLRVHVVTPGVGSPDAPGDPAAMLDPTGTAHRRYGARRPSVHLVRPDAVIGFRGRLDDTDALHAHLERALGVRSAPPARRSGAVAAAGR